MSCGRGMQRESCPPSLPPRVAASQSPNAPPLKAASQLPRMPKCFPAASRLPGPSKWISSPPRLGSPLEGLRSGVSKASIELLFNKSPSVDCYPHLPPHASSGLSAPSHLNILAQSELSPIPAGAVPSISFFAHPQSPFCWRKFGASSHPS